MNTILPDFKLPSKNIAIVGDTGCGKTVLVQSLLAQAQDQGIKVIGMDWTWMGEASELGEWAAGYQNTHRHLVGGCLSEIFLTASPLILDLEYSFDISALDLDLSACCDVISQTTSVDKFILCINGVDQLLNYSVGVKFLDTIANCENIQLILVSQLIDSFNMNILKNLPIILIGQIDSIQLECLKETLDCPESTIRECAEFVSPSQQSYSSWLVARSQDVPTTERFQFYHHRVGQLVASSQVPGG